MAKADSAGTRNELDDTDPLEGDWKDTDHDRVYYAQDQLSFDRGEYEVAVQIAEAFPKWKVVITIGPHRSYDISYKIRPDHRAIHLDFYSVRPQSGYVAEVATNIHRGIEELREDGVIDEV